MGYTSQVNRQFRTATQAVAKLKLTQDVIAKTRQILGNGGYAETVFTTLKIGKATYYRWLARGERARKGVYRDFWDAVMEATGVAEINALQIVTQSKDPRIAAWFLEHRFPERWGRRVERKENTSSAHTANGSENRFIVNVVVEGEPSANISEHR
jgi:hypothetical protein